MAAHRLLLCLACFALCLALGQGAAPGSVGGCSSVAADQRWACVTNWVLAEQAAANGPPGSSCASVSPASRDECVANYIAERQRALLPGKVGGCSSVAPNYKRACAIQAVLDWQDHGLPRTNPAPTTGLVGGCATVTPGYQQACLNTYAIQLQAAQQAKKGNTAPGATCASVRPGPDQDACIQRFVIGLQQARNPGLVGGCAGVAPTYRQACVNTFLLELQKGAQAQQAKAQQPKAGGQQQQQKGGVGAAAPLLGSSSG